MEECSIICRCTRSFWCYHACFSYQLGLIDYHHVAFEAWIYVFTAWIALYLGTAVIKLGANIIFPMQSKATTFPNLNMKRLRWAIILLSLAGIASSAVLALDIVRSLNADTLLVALMEQANKIYELRFNAEVSGLMYVVFLPYAGCALSGVYTARLGRITISALLPIFAMLVDGIISMQRFGMFVGPLLFVFSYLLTPKIAKLYVPRWQKVGIICVVVSGFFIVTAQRTGSQVFEGESTSLANAGDVVPGLPSLYFYASAPVPCLSEYLKHPEQEGAHLWGRYTFASIYRFASRFGFDTYVPYYGTFYSTPIPDNAATYLRDVHWDFGGTAIFLFPFGLGLLIALLEVRAPTVLTIVLGSFLYLVIFFSCHFNYAGGGNWYFPLPIALLIAQMVRVPSFRRRVQPESLAVSFSPNKKQSQFRPESKFKGFRVPSKQVFMFSILVTICFACLFGYALTSR